MAFQQGYSDNDGATSSTVNVTVTSGDALVLLVWGWDVSSNAMTHTPGGTVGGTWEEITGGAIDNATDEIDQRVYLNRTPTAGTGTVTYSVSPTPDGTWIKVFRLTEVPAGAIGGVATAVTNRQTAPGTGVTGVTSGNHTPPTSGNWIQIGVSVNWAGGGAPTPNTGAGFTDLNLNWDFGGAFSEASYITGSGTTAVAATFTRGSTGVHHTTSIIVAQSAGGGGGASFNTPLLLMGMGR